MRGEPRYLWFTIVTLVSIVLVTSASPGSLLLMAGVATAALCLIATAYVLMRSRRQFVAVTLVGLAAMLPVVYFVLFPRTAEPHWANRIYVMNVSLWLLFTGRVALMVFRGIMKARRIGGNEVYGAIYVYLLIGVLFAQMYQVLLAADPGALYFDPGRFPAPQVLGPGLYTRGAGDILYYSFVTLGTVGYGDVTPSSALARSMSLIEAVTGIMYVATMIARFVSIQISADHRGAQPPSPAAAPMRSPSSEGLTARTRREDST